MGVELRFAPDLTAAERAELGYATAADAVGDERGEVVRATPRHRTLRGPRVGAVDAFRKLHPGAGALAEWHLLGELARRGHRVPRRLCVARDGDRSVLVIAAAPGRAMDEVLREAATAGGARAAEAIRYCVDVVAPAVRRLHADGWAHRDLYWNHLFCEGFGTAPPCLIDVERVFRPRWRRRRWRIKDLAALLASTPDPLPRTAALRFLRAYRGGLDRGWKRWARAITAKARRFRRHRPRHG